MDLSSWQNISACPERENRATTANFERPASTPAAQLAHARLIILCPYVVIEGSKVLRHGGNVGHVSPDLVQFSIVLRLSRVRCLERVNLQPRPWI